MFRVRIRFAKTGDLRFISHLDLLRTFERSLERAALPLAYSEGFNPKPRISIPAALPVGVEGLNEILEVELRETWGLDRVLAALVPALPPLLSVHGAEIPGSDEARGEYLGVLEIELREAPGDLGARIESFLAAERFVVRRAREDGIQEVDIRPFLAAVRVSGSILRANVRSTPRGSARPDEILGALGLSREQVRRIARVDLLPVK